MTPEDHAAELAYRRRRLDDGRHIAAQAYIDECERRGKTPSQDTIRALLNLHEPG